MSIGRIPPNGWQFLGLLLSRLLCQALQVQHRLSGKTACGYQFCILFSRTALWSSSSLSPIPAHSSRYLWSLRPPMSAEYRNGLTIFLKHFYHAILLLKKSAKVLTLQASPNYIPILMPSVLQLTVSSLTFRPLHRLFLPGTLSVDLLPSLLPLLSPCC